MHNEIVIDVDVHQTWASDESLRPYLSKEWEQFFFSRETPFAPPAKYGRFQPQHLRYPQIMGTAMRPEAVTPGGGPPGSNYETLLEQLIIPHKIDRGILTWGIGLNAAVLNVSASIAICRAANEYLIDYWLSRKDNKLFGLLNVPLASPSEAAKEIRRLGNRSGIAGVLVIANTFNKPLGHPVYHPIYEAAVEMSLPIVTHLGGDNINKGSFAAGGSPTSKVEYYTLLDQSSMHNLSSIISEGVLEMYPGLKFLFNESGFTWIPWLLWALDSRYKMLKRECPELKLLPSEYFQRQVWTGIQPIWGVAESNRVVRLLEAFGGFETRLCYASDYPHWDAEWPSHARPRLPTAWRQGIMGENACELFGWSADEIRATRQRAAA